MRMIKRSTGVFAVSLVAALSFSEAPAAAQPWPQRTVRVIVPLPPGGGTDVVTRLFAEKLSERWRQPVIVENRQGSDGLIAASAFVSARDNHTLLASFAGLISVNPLIYDKLPYDPARDLVPICSLADNFIGIAVSESLKVKSLSEFVELVRSRPGKLNWAATPGMPYYVFMALLKSTALDMVQVNYRDFTPAFQDLATGRIHAAITGLPPFLPHVQAGTVRLLMVASRERSPSAPDVPTAEEAGLPELTFDGVVGFYGWRDMPLELRERIAADVRGVAADGAIAARAATLGTLVRVRGPAEFAAAVEEQRVKIAAIAKGMKPAE